MTDCPFCNPDPARLFAQGDDWYCLWDAHPVSPGHALVIPRAHVVNWFDAAPSLQANLLTGLRRAHQVIRARHTPDGFNVGMNVLTAAGQTVPHLHVHVIPRYVGDVANPTGGVRNVIPGAGDYLGDGVREPAQAYTPGALLGRDDAPLLPALARDLAEAVRVDLAVAFVLESGLDLLWPHLDDMLARASAARLRIVTGDYMGVTEPAALHRLLDLGDAYPNQVQVRVFEARGGRSFHPKAYLVGQHEHGAAYIGSSNLSRSALERGVEWNYRLSSQREQGAVTEVSIAFEQLFVHPATVPLTPAWIASYAGRRNARTAAVEAGIDPLTDAPAPPPTPHAIQQQALQALLATRAAGHRAGLVVLATGLGKTWLAAFDSATSRRVLFVAHREEILAQAREVFRRIRPDATLGSYAGAERDRDADVLFASVMTLGKTRHLESFNARAFDYIVIDEFHHAAAATYRRLIDHFDADFLLALTATPDRTDGADLLTLCGENLVFRCDLADGICQDLLSPFHYFGVPDLVDYANIPWRSGRFDPQALEHAVVTEARAANAFEQWQTRAGQRTLAFCVSQRHADYMQAHFDARGVRCAAVHSGAASAPRTLSLERLRDGALQVVFAVDMFNEGVDVPSIDTVLMLRPTESRILWLQQFGRGLRKAEGKPHLNVIDYIGNHRCFVQGAMQLLPGVGDRPGNLAMALERLERDELELPPGCAVTYELEALQILHHLVQPTRGVEAIRNWYLAFELEFDVRPTATEAWHAGFDPGLVRGQFGSWLEFVGEQGGLTAGEMDALRDNREFLADLETTRMTKSYKMLVLRGLCVAERLPGSIAIDELVGAFRREARRSPLLAEDVGAALEDDAELRRLVERNPIKAWTGTPNSGGGAFFKYKDGRFSNGLRITATQPGALRTLVRELVDLRLAQYLARTHQVDQLAPVIRCRLWQSNGNPILKLPDRDKHPGIPLGTTTVLIDGEPFEAPFVQIAVNVLRRPGESTNVLPEMLRAWFGDSAGAPGNTQWVTFELGDDGYTLRPEPVHDGRPVLWQEYLRDDIPPLWQLEFNLGNWNQGVVRTDGAIFLLVSLEKNGLQEAHQYGDRFLSDETLEWHSQNQTRRDSPSGQRFRNHAASGDDVHLFVRRTRKTPGGRGAPFTYCGTVDFQDWEGDRPIVIRWRLAHRLPRHVRVRFGLDGS